MADHTQDDATKHASNPAREPKDDVKGNSMIGEAKEVASEKMEEAADWAKDGLKTAGESTRNAFRQDVEDAKDFVGQEIRSVEHAAHMAAHPSEIAGAVEEDAQRFSAHMEKIGHEIVHPEIIVGQAKESLHEHKAEANTSKEKLEDSTKSAIDKEKLPWPVKLFGVLCILGGFITIYPLVSMIIETVGLFSAGSLNDEGTFAIVVSFLQLANYALLIVAFVFLGVRLWLNNRRHAAMTMTLIQVFIVLGILCSIMLHGISWYLILYAIILVIMVALQSYVDPSLKSERKSRRQKRSLKTQEEAQAGTLGRDTSGGGYITLNFFNLFWVFVICSMLGLLFETIYHAIVFGGYQDRAGLLFGPFSPIYGCGAVLMTLFLNRLHKRNVILIFFISAIIGGAFEYFTSWFMQYAFGAVAWNYTGMWLSIGGRTCGLFMCMWGLLGVVWIKLLLPIMLHVVNLIPWNWRYTITAVCAVLMATDAVITLMALDCWYMRLSGDPIVTPMQQFCNAHFDNTFMADRFQSMTITPGDVVRAHT